MSVGQTLGTGGRGQDNTVGYGGASIQEEDDTIKFSTLRWICFHVD